MACNLFRCLPSTTCSGPCNSSNHTTKRDQPLAKNAFQSLSPEEQDQAYEDIYGLDNLIEETPDFIKSKLEELDNEVSLLNVHVQKPYTRAKEQQEAMDGNDNYVCSEKFRLMFLRAERFDARKAALRLTSNFQEKLKLFGDEKLARRITQADLDERDKEALRSGAVWMTGATDRFGRVILLGRRQHALQGNIMSMMRALYYIVHKVMEGDELLQKKGIVLIGYNLREKIGMHPSKARATLPLPRMGINALPMRWTGIHICYDDLREHIFTNLFLVVFPKEFRARFQGHFSRTYDECIFSLMKYGIDVETLPLTADGEFQYDLWHEYLDNQRQGEEEGGN